MKKFLAVTLISVMLASLCACVPQADPIDSQDATTAPPTQASSASAEAEATVQPPESLPPATMTYWTELSDPIVQSNDEITGFRYLQESTNIDIEFIHPPIGQGAEQFNLLIVSNDLPDLIRYDWGSYPGGIEAAVQSGLLIELNDVIDTQMPNYRAYLDRFPEVEMMTMTDSGLHCVVPGMYTTTPEGMDHHPVSGRIPAYETYLGMYVRRDWIEQLNMAIPTTVDDWVAMLRAFKNDLGATAPMSITSGFLKETCVFLSAYDICFGLFEDDKVVKYGPYEESYRDYLTLMNLLYSEGLLDNDFATLDNTAFTAKVLTDDTGAWSGYTSTHCGVLYDQIHGENPDATFYPIGVKNPVLNQGQQLKYRQAAYPVLFSVAAGITAACDDPSIPARVIDWGFSDEGETALNWGAPDESAVTIVDGWPAWTDAVAKDPNYSPTQMYRKYCAYNGPFPIDHWSRLLSKGSYTTPESINALVTWEQENGLNPNVMPPVSLLSTETSDYANLFNQVNTYASEMYIQFIMGSEPLSNFDAYVKDLESMGVQDVIRMQQSALDRYYQR